MEKSVEQYQAMLKDIQGKTIAVVYIHEDDDAKGYNHYNIWGSPIIASWINGIGELGCKPYILDLRTFISKAMNNTLPHIDFVVNLNNGVININTLTLLPSTCAFLGIPCIPTDSTTTIIAEHKLISNIIAFQNKIKTPHEFSSQFKKGIIRPYTLGSSIGIKRQDFISDKKKDVIHQEFIEGIEMTTPMLYNPVTDELEVLPSFIYYPKSYSKDWFFDEVEKSNMDCEKKVVEISEELKDSFSSLAKSFFIKSYCRIDTRIKCESEQEVNEKINNPIGLDDTYFIEINSMPTINNSKYTQFSLKHLTDDFNMSLCYDAYESYTGVKTIAGFILSCSILSYIKAKCKKQ